MSRPQGNPFPEKRKRNSKVKATTYQEECKNGKLLPNYSKKYIDNLMFSFFVRLTSIIRQRKSCPNRVEVQSSKCYCKLLLIIT